MLSGFRRLAFAGAILVVGIDSVAQKKWDCISALPSQFGDADSWQARYRTNIPTEENARKAALIEIVRQSNVDIANKYRDVLVKEYGQQKGAGFKYAEAFELNQYGTGATQDQLKAVFPTFK